jgi:phosphatidylethanolamine-binding protein (PEBP) family uncharacterized protein
LERKIEIRITLKRYFGMLGTVGIAIGLVTMPALAQDVNPSSSFFQLGSTTFANNTTLPISAINNIVMNNVNVCSIDGSPGGNQSLELSWTGAPPGARSFVVTTYDLTASFTHWGMYNIAGYRNNLP